MSTWTIKAVDPDGTVRSTSTDATIASIELALNHYGSAEISFPTLDAILEDLISVDGSVLGELQLWCDADLVGWLIPTGVDAGETTTTLHCAGLGWLLTSRYVGDFADRNLLTNPGFEDDLTAWTNTGIDDATAQSSVNAMDGTHVARLEPADAGVNQHLHQVHALAVDDVDAEDYVLTGNVWVDPLTPFTPAIYNLGLVLLCWDGSNYIAGAWADGGQLTENASRTYWTRLHSHVHLPDRTSGDTWELHAVLMAPSGVVYWDHIRLLRVERLEYNGWDQASIAEALVQHAQDATVNKADLSIDTDCPTTSVPRTRIYPWAGHDNIWDALVELANADDGLDFDIVVTPTTRTFTTWARRGSVTPVLTVTWGDNLAALPAGLAFRFAASSCLVTGDGSTDETGRADEIDQVWDADVHAFEGRLLERIEQKPGGPYVNATQMENYATGLVDEGLRPATLELPVHRTDTADPFAMFIAGDLQLGDQIDLVIDHGWILIDHTARVTKIALDPASELVTLTVTLATIES